MTMAEKLQGWAKSQKPVASVGVEALTSSYKNILRSATKRADLVGWANRAVEDGCNPIAVEEEVKRCAARQERIWRGRVESWLREYGTELGEEPEVLGAEAEEQRADVHANWTGWANFIWRAR